MTTGVPSMIGYYVHHHGAGHLQRAQVIARASARPVTVLTSLPRPVDIAPFAGWIDLPRDDDDATPRDPTAGGALHWVPLGSAGLRDRTARLAGWIAHARPAVVVVDVSVEIALAVRLHGVPVVVMAQPGIRTDAPHDLVHRIATAIIAPWPADVLRLPHLDGHRVDHVGALSRFDGMTAVEEADGNEVLVLLGSGGTEVGPAEITALAGACPQFEVRAVGGPFGWKPDLAAALSRAAVVITHAGLNAVAEVAALARPAIVVAAERPFGEQRCTATALDAAQIAVGLSGWPAAPRWPALLTEAQRRGGAGWSRWNDGQGAARAAAVLDRVAARA